MLAAHPTAAIAQDLLRVLDDRQIPSLTGVTAVAVGDYDRDGDLDLFAARNNALQAALLLNDGGGGFVIANDRLPRSLDEAYACATADVDGDGDLDLAIGISASSWQVTSQNKLYINDGAGRFVHVPSAIPTLRDDTTCLAFGDMDGDGDPDLLVGNWVHDDVLYENDGSGRFTDVTASRLPQGGGPSWVLHFVDLDRDGDLDVIRAGSDSSILANDGSGRFVEVGANTLPDFAMGAAMQDVDRDGLPDLWIMTTDLPTRLHLFINRGGMVLADETAQRVSTLSLGTQSFAAFDVDGDGDGDVIANQAGYLRLLSNDGSGRFSDGGIRAQTVGPLRTSLDVDGDGDVDLVAATTSWGSALLLNDGRGHFADSHVPRMPVMTSIVGAIALGDVDGDQMLDAFLGGIGGYPAPDSILRNDGHGRLHAHGLLEAGEVQAAVFADVDRDGDLDLLVGCNGRNRYFANDGAGSLTDVSSARLPWDGDDTRALALGDVDGDGRLDFVAATFAGQNRLYLGYGTGSFYDHSQRLPQRRDATVGLALGDVDGDGDPDLAVGAELLVNEDGQFRTARPLPVPPGESSFVALGDFDRDGDLDLLHAIGTQVTALRNDGSGAFSVLAVLPLPGSVAQLALADFDADGDPEGLARTSGPEAATFLLASGGSSWSLVRIAGAGAQPFALGDLDGDDDVDVVERVAFVNCVRQAHVPARAQIGAVLRAEMFCWQGGATFPALALEPLLPRLRLGALGALGLDPRSMVVLPALGVPQYSSALLEIPIPNNGSLRGATVYLQALAFAAAEPHLTGVERRALQ